MASARTKKTAAFSVGLAVLIALGVLQDNQPNSVFLGSGNVVTDPALNQKPSQILGSGAYNVYQEVVLQAVGNNLIGAIKNPTSSGSSVTGQDLSLVSSGSVVREWGVNCGSKFASQPIDVAYSQNATGTGRNVIAENITVGTGTIVHSFASGSLVQKWFKDNYLVFFGSGAAYKAQNSDCTGYVYSKYKAGIAR